VADRIRFHFDEHIDTDIALALRRHGVDVTTTNEVGLRTRGDDEHLTFATRERRVIVTDDPDFLRLAATGIDHPGIVICHRASRSMRDIIHGLILIYEGLAPDEMHGRVEYL
jgi:predicted nuclease of predicted toxin-antitoxin system